MSSEDKFKAAVNVIKNLPKQGSFQPSTVLQLKFYSYFKQATEGPCTISKPSFWDVVGKAKWDAWKNLGNMPKEEAMEKYVDELKKIVETMSYTENVSKFMEILGPFYEFVPIEFLPNGKGPIAKESDKESDDDDVEEETSSDSELMRKMIENKGKGPINGRINGFGDSDESEGDEFSDTYDHIKEARGGADQNNTSSSGNNNPRPGGSDSGVSSTAGANSNRGGARSRNNTRDVAQNPFTLYGSSGGAGGHSGGSSGPLGMTNDINEQLGLAVIKLQHSMDNVTARLASLERGLQNPAHARHRGVFGSLGVSPQFLAVVLLWPFVAQWLMHVVRRRSKA